MPEAVRKLSPIFYRKVSMDAVRLADPTQSGCFPCSQAKSAENCWVVAVTSSSTTWPSTGGSWLARHVSLTRIWLSMAVERTAIEMEQHASRVARSV